MSPRVVPRPLLASLLVFALIAGTARHARAAATDAAAGPWMVSGRVLDAATAQPIAGANVQSGATGTVTDAAGRFALRAAAGDTLVVSHVGYHPVRLAAAPALRVLLQARSWPADEVVVRGTLVEQTLSGVAASLSVLAERQVAAAQGGHLEALTRSIPNLNWAGGTSRPRYFQIRGVGERSHYAGEGPPTTAVGFVLDDVDLSGLGSAALLFDVAQVEVFRGPQSSVFGPNSMAGLIRLESAAPAATPERHAALTVGSDALLRTGASASWPLHPRLALRLGYAEARENGFRTNEFLGRDDTNRRHEALARAKFRWEAPAGACVVGTVFHADLDNGYDAWAPDNNGRLRTYTDRPGQDRQQTTGMSLRSRVPLGSGTELLAITALSHTDALYSYDSDWGNDAYWAAPPYGFDPVAEGWRYDFFDRTHRQRDMLAQEARLLWDRLIVGAFGKALRESDAATGYLFGGDATDLASTFDVTDLALYAQWGGALGAGLGWSLNARADRNAIAYDGRTDPGARRVAFDAAEWLWGGKAALTWRPAAGRTAYAAVSRGYSPGGVNQHPLLAPQSRRYDPEYLTSVEVGYRRAAARRTTAATAFHTWRADQQVDLSSQQDPGDPNSFVYYIANASAGTSYGLELEHEERVAELLTLSGSLGLLHTRVDAYTFWTDVGERRTLGGRGAAHAPGYMYGLAAELGRSRGPRARLELTGMDGFYYSQSHDQRAPAHRLVNAQAGYAGRGWAATLWCRNVLDERYPVRGFYFGLEPPDYPDRLYVAYGDPRQIGCTVTADW